MQSGQVHPALLLFAASRAVGDKVAGTNVESCSCCDSSGATGGRERLGVEAVTGCRTNTSSSNAPSEESEDAAALIFPIVSDALSTIGAEIGDGAAGEGKSS